MGEGRKWSVTEIASLEEPTPTDDTAEDESEDVAQTLIVRPPAQQSFWRVGSGTHSAPDTGPNKEGTEGYAE